ncbi:hypothetical protein CLAIMM_02639 [Cladophialophora immunda]|nr:hypothetical protein CLAIMM_02639 [Cladophialophora immunda]
MATTLPKSNGIENDEAQTSEASNPRNVRIKVQIQNLGIAGFISSSTGVANFLNIPYARIPARFRQAKLIDPREEIGIIDATKYGPCCPQPLDALHFKTSHLYNEMINIGHSAEFSCLNLNIYAPPDAISSDKKLPVLVWIHGGGWTYGDGGCEYDGNYIVQHSITIGKPVIFVTFNYRLGYYGFLSSKEIKDEACRHGDAGFANLGFHDQRLALQWVQKNICLFGGDGSAITASGESAGAFALLAHLRSNFPAFQRAFILSAPLRQLVGESVAQANFDQLVSKTGLAVDAPASVKLDAIRSLTATEMANELKGEYASPIWDPEWFPDQSAQSILADAAPLPPWIKGVVIGYAKEETALFCSHLNNLSCAERLEILKKSFGPGELLDGIMAAYGITDGDSSDATMEKTLDAILQTSSYGVFGFVASQLSNHTEIPVSLYTFEQTDTFEESGFLKGRSYHSLGNPMLFRLPTVNGPEDRTDMKRTSNALCEAAITLTYGEQPWEPFAQNQNLMVFDGEKTGLVPFVDKKLPWMDLVLPNLQKFMEGCADLVLRGLTASQAPSI